VVERSRRKREMNDSNITRVFLTTAVLAAVAALLAVPAQAMFLDDGGAVVTSEPQAPRIDRAVAAADKAFEAYSGTTAIAAREALQSPTQTARPSVGLNGDSALTRAVKPASSTTPAVSSDDDFDWTWVGVCSGLAALLAAALGGFYLSARHRGRIALP
jgi:hypothetical protein